MNTIENLNPETPDEMQIEVFEHLAQEYVDELKLLKEISVPFINFDYFEPESTFIFNIKGYRLQKIKNADNESIILRGNMIRVNFNDKSAFQQFCEFIVPQQFQTRLENLFGNKISDWIDKRIVCKYQGTLISNTTQREYKAFIIQTTSKTNKSKSK